MPSEDSTRSESPKPTVTLTTEQLLLIRQASVRLRNKGRVGEFLAALELAPV